MTDSKRSPLDILSQELEAEAIEAIIPTFEKLYEYVNDPKDLGTDIDEFDEGDEENTTLESQKRRAQLEHLKEALAKILNETLWDVVGESILKDQTIKTSARICRIDQSFRVTRSVKEQLDFSLPEVYFDSWLEGHQKDLGLKFILKRKPYLSIIDGIEQERSDYVCQCSSTNSPTTRNDKTKRNSIKRAVVGCGSKIVATKQPRATSSGGTIQVVDVWYKYRHNHAVGMVSEMDSERKVSIITKRLHGILASSKAKGKEKETSVVLHRLIMDRKRLLRCVTGSSPMFMTVGDVTYDDFYHVLYKHYLKKSRRDDNPLDSANKWMEEQAEAGCFTVYNPLGKYYGISSPWQLQQLKEYGDVFCFDGTRLCGNDIYLFSVVVQSRVSGIGIPVSFFITCDLDSADLVIWLSGLKENMKTLGIDYTPSIVITDQGKDEVSAITKVFPGVKIFYSEWSILQTWEHTLMSPNLGINSLPSDIKEEYRTKLREDLRSILFDTNEVTALQRIMDFRQQWKNKHPKIADYIDRKYLNEYKRKEWMLCYKHEELYDFIDINNCISSWHNVLHHHFFKEYRDIRADFIIFTLTKMILTYYPHWLDHYTHHIKELTKVRESTRAAKIASLDVYNRQNRSRTKLKFVMATNSPSIFAVRSFHDPEQFHKIFYDVAEGLFVGCSCRGYDGMKKCCKHVSLAMIEIPFTDYEYREYSRVHSRLIGKDVLPDDGFVLVKSPSAANGSKFEIGEVHDTGDADDSGFYYYDEEEEETVQDTKLQDSPDILSIYINKVYAMENARDTSVKFKPEERKRLEDLMKQVYDLYSKYNS